MAKSPEKRTRKGGRKKTRCGCEIHCYHCKGHRPGCPNPSGCPQCRASELQGGGGDEESWKESSGNDAFTKVPTLDASHINATKRESRRDSFDLFEALGAEKVSATTSKKGEMDTRLLRGESSLKEELCRLEGLKGSLIDKAKGRGVSWEDKATAWHEVYELQHQIHDIKLRIIEARMGNKLLTKVTELKEKVSSFMKDKEQSLDDLKHDLKDIESYYERELKSIMKEERETYGEELQAIRSRFHQRLKALNTGSLQSKVGELQYEVDEAREETKNIRLSNARAMADKKRAEDRAGVLATQLGRVKDDGGAGEKEEERDIPRCADDLDDSIEDTWSDATLWRRKMDVLEYIVRLTGKSLKKTCQLVEALYDDRFTRSVLKHTKYKPVNEREEDKWVNEMVDQACHIMSSTKGTKHDNMAKEAFLTFVAPLYKGRCSKQFEWMKKKFNVGNKRLERARRRLKRLLDSDFEDGVLFHEERATRKDSKNHAYPHILQDMYEKWLSPLLTEASSHKNDWTIVHVKQKKCHTYTPGESGKKELKCIPAEPLDLSGLTCQKAAEVLVNIKLGTTSRCYKMQTRAMNKPSERALYQDYISDLRTRQPDWVELVSFTWFKNSRPRPVKNAKRKTGLCNYCLGFEYVAQDYMTHNAHRPVEARDLTGGDDGDGGGSSDSDNGHGDERGVRVRAKVLLHHNCRSPCQWCRSGGCQPGRHPMTPGTDVHGKEGVAKKIRDSIMCPKATTTYKCYQRTCEDCKWGKRGVSMCPLEREGAGECQWKVITYEKEAKDG